MCLKQIFLKNFSDPFFWSFFQPSLAPKLLKSHFFSMIGIGKLGHAHAFQPYPYSLRPFPKGGGRPPGYT